MRTAAAAPAAASRKLGVLWWVGTRKTEKRFACVECVDALRNGEPERGREPRQLANVCTPGRFSCITIPMGKASKQACSNKGDGTGRTFQLANRTRFELDRCVCVCSKDKWYRFRKQSLQAPVGEFSASLCASLRHYWPEKSGSGRTAGNVHFLPLAQQAHTGTIT